MNLVADNLMIKISDLNVLAQNGNNIAQSLVENNQRSEKILDELEILIKQPNLEQKIFNLSSVAQPISSEITRVFPMVFNPEAKTPKNLEKKLGESDKNFADITGLNNTTKDKENLVKKINSTFTLSKKLNIAFFSRREVHQRSPAHPP